MSSAAEHSAETVAANVSAAASAAEALVAAPVADVPTELRASRSRVSTIGLRRQATSSISPEVASTDAGNPGRRVSLGGMCVGSAAGAAETAQGPNKWKTSVFKATALTSEADDDPARSTKKSSFLALVEAASHEMNASRKIADDIMQRDLARLVTEEESKGAPNLARRPTMHRMKSHASSMLEGRDESAMGQLDGRQIMHFNHVRVLLPHHLAMRVSDWARIAHLSLGAEGLHGHVASTRARPLYTRLAAACAQIWTSLVVFVELYEAISLPYSVAFSDGQYIAALLTVDAVFLVDLVVNFFTAYREKATNK